MFVAFQFPFTDARPFLQDETYRLLSPSWPLPMPNAEFIRSFGVVKRRVKGGISDWPGENIYCGAARALRFEPPFTNFKNLDGSISRIKQYCAFRRFVADGCAVARLELGIGYREYSHSFVDLGQKDFLALIHSVLEQSVSVPSGNDFYKTKLLTAGQQLAKHYLHASTRRIDKKLSPVESWWIHSGEPLLVVEYEIDELSELPKYARHVQNPTLVHAQVSLSHVWIELNGREVGVWLLGYSPYSNSRDILRRLRMILFRLHAEQESIKQVFRQIITKKIEVQRGTEATERLQQYLQSAVSLLSKKSREGLPQSNILAAAQQAKDFISEGERTTLLSQLVDIRRNLLRNIDRFTLSETSSLAPDEEVKSIYNINVSAGADFTVIQKLENNASKKEIHMGDTFDNIGGDVKKAESGSIIAENSIVNYKTKLDSVTQTIQSAAGIPNEKKVELEQHVKQLKDELDAISDVEKQERADDIEAVVDSLDLLVKNGSKPSEKRNESLLKITGEGLKEAAKALADIAPTIISTAIFIVKAIVGA